MRNNILQNILWMSSDQILKLAVGFFVGAWTARYLQPESFGLLNFSIALVSIFLPLVSLDSLNQVIVGDLTRKPESRDEIIGTTLGLKFLGFVLASICSILLVLITRSDDFLSQQLVLVLTISMLFAPFDIVELWFQTKLRSKYTVIAKNVSFLITALLRIGLIYFQAPVIAFAVVITIDSVMKAVAFLIAYKIENGDLFSFKFNFPQVLNLLRGSWPFVISGFAITIYLKIDLAMLGGMAGDYSVGIYSAAIRFTDMCTFLPTAIVASFTPSIISAKICSEKEFYERLQRLFDMMIILSLLLIWFMMLFAVPVIKIVYGQSYEPSAGILIIHIWSLLFMCLGSSKNIWVVTENKGLFLMFSSISGALLNIFLNLLLIPKYQGTGAAIATLISYGFTDYITCFLYPPTRILGRMMTNSMVSNSLLKSLFCTKN